MRARAPGERRDPISHKLLTNQELTLPFLSITLTLSIDCLLQQSSFFLTGLHILSPVSPFSNRSGYTAPRITFYLFIFYPFFMDSFRVKQFKKGGGKGRKKTVYPIVCTHRTLFFGLLLLLTRNTHCLPLTKCKFDNGNGGHVSQFFLCCVVLYYLYTKTLSPHIIVIILT